VVVVVSSVLVVAVLLLVGRPTVELVPVEVDVAPVEVVVIVGIFVVGIGPEGWATEDIYIIYIFTRHMRRNK